MVTLRNLQINGNLGNGIVPPGTDGIRVIGGGAAVHVENCTIQGGSQQGIDFAPSSSVDLFVRDTVVSNNAGGGVLLMPTVGASIRVTFDNVAVEGNATGMLIDGRATTGSNALTIRNSTIAGGSGFGAAVYEGGTGVSTMTIEGSTVANNATFGVVASGATATARLVNSVVSGNARGLITTSGGNIVSQGGNMVAGNTVNGAFTQTLPLQ